MKRVILGAMVCLISVSLASCGGEAPEPEPEPDPCEAPDELDDVDTDADGVIDMCDNCPQTVNPDQLDSDSDGDGDLCDADIDDDGYANDEDLCPTIYHPLAEDTDSDGIGDVCDRCPNGEDQIDSDSDGFDDCEDLCRFTSSTENEDSDGDGVGDACDVCPDVPDAGQVDSDSDGVGDACDDALPFSVEELTIAKLHAAIEGGEVTCAQVVEGYLDRIQRLDKSVVGGPPINSMMMINPSVREQAAELDAYFAENGKLKGSLHCAPYVVKDLYNTKELPVSSGSLALVGTRPRSDGFAVGRIRSRGGVLIGTTTMDEYSQGIFGVSSRSGRAGNAYDASRNAGGSSSGSGAAVGANFAIAGTGTDNCASLSIPASYNGLVTLRSSIGVVSLRGVYPSSRLDAIAGPMTRSVRDLALFFDAMAGEDPEYSLTHLGDGVRPGSYMDSLDLDGLEGKRIGVLRAVGRDTSEFPENPFTRADVHTQSVYQRALREMERNGATIVENVFFHDLNRQRSSAGGVQEFEQWLAQTDGPHDSYVSMCKSENISKFAKRAPETCESNYQWHQTRGRLDGDYYNEIRDRYKANADHIAAVLDSLDLDAVVLPVDSYGGARVNSAKSNCVTTSVSGTPSMNVVVGYSRDATPLPIGMMFIGRRYSEPELFELAYAYEQATNHRRPPRYSAEQLTREVPALVPDDFNDAALAVGRLSFDRVLKDADSRFALSSAIFREIVREVVEAKGWGWLSSSGD